MLSLRNELPHGLLDHGPLVHDLRVAESNDPVSKSGKLGITTSVSLKRIAGVVKFSTIDLDNESIADHKVDTTHTRDVHLTLHMTSHSLQSQPEQRLCARLANSCETAARVPLCKGGLWARQPSLQCTLERDSERLKGAAVLEISQRKGDFGHRSCRALRLSAPVRHDVR